MQIFSTAIPAHTPLLNVDSLTEACIMCYSYNHNKQNTPTVTEAAALTVCENMARFIISLCHFQQLINFEVLKIKT